MTVKQLKEELNKYPDHMDVFIAKRKTGYVYDLLNSTRSEDIELFEEGNRRVKANDRVVILDID